MVEKAGFPIIALSVRQPWAWCIFNGKDIENRTKFAVTKGNFKPKRIAIHASQTMTENDYECARFFIKDRGVECPRPDALIRGGIIGFVTVTKIVDASDSPWFVGDVGLVLADPVECEPIPSKGALGYFKWQVDGELKEPTPWMRAWPESVKRIRKAKKEKEDAKPVVEHPSLFDQNHNL